MPGLLRTRVRRENLPSLLISLPPRKCARLAPEEQCSLRLHLRAGACAAVRVSRVAPDKAPARPKKGGKGEG